MIYTVLVSLVVIAAVLMCLVVLIQESKGGGLASSFASSNQIMGVRKTTDFIEKLTWGLAAAMVLFSILSAFYIPTASGTDSVITKQATEQQATNPNNIPAIPTAPAQQDASAAGAQAPAGEQAN